MRHSETAFIPINTGRKVGGPWFAIAFLRWSARDCRKAMIESDPRDPAEAWGLLRKGGWRIVKVKISSLSNV